MHILLDILCMLIMSCSPNTVFEGGDWTTQCGGFNEKSDLLEDSEHAAQDPCSCMHRHGVLMSMSGLCTDLTIEALFTED